MSRAVETHNAIAGLVQLYQGLIAELTRECEQVRLARDNASRELGNAMAQIQQLTENRDNLDTTMRRQAADNAKLQERIAELEHRVEVLTARVVAEDLA